MTPVPNVLPRGADTYLCQLAPFAGRIEQHATPLSSYRVHDNNWFWRPIEDQIALSIAWTTAGEAAAIERFLGGDRSRVPEWHRQSWWRRLQHAIDELDQRVPAGARLLVVDDQALGAGPVRGRQVRPFPERDGIWWGQPADDAQAIRELKRERQDGPQYLVLLWTSFWWRDHYPRFWSHLENSARQLVADDTVLIFDLAPVS